MMKSDKASVIAAVITALGSLLIFTLSISIHQDERLDRLEQVGRILIDEEGKLRANREALDSYYRTEYLQQRLDRLENSRDAYP